MQYLELFVQNSEHKTKLRRLLVFMVLQQKVGLLSRIFDLNKLGKDVAYYHLSSSLQDTNNSFVHHSCIKTV